MPRPGEAKGGKKTTMMTRTSVEPCYEEGVLERFLRFASAARFLPRGFEGRGAAAGLIEEEEDDDDDDGGTTRDYDDSGSEETMKVKQFKKQSELRKEVGGDGEERSSREALG